MTEETKDPAINYWEDQPLTEAEMGEDKMERLNALIAKYRELGAACTEAATTLGELEEEYKKYERDLIPQLMEELGMTQIKMEDGSTVKVEDSVNASVKAEDKPAFFTWLRENEFDGMIKTKLQAEFGKGEGEDAQEAYAALIDLGVEAAMAEDVHAQTLKSFVKEQLEEGKELPTCIGVFTFKKAKITAAKKKKK